MIGKGLVSGGNPPIMRAATSRRPLSKGGISPDAYGYLAEFGGRSAEFTTYKRRSPNGGTHEVTRRTRLGLPRRSSSGRVVYPAASEAAPRMASLWVQTFVRTVYEALEESCQTYGNQDSAGIGCGRCDPRCGACGGLVRRGSRLARGSCPRGAQVRGFSRGCWRWCQVGRG